MSKVALKFKERVTEAGNTVVEAAINAKLLRMSDKFFDYVNAKGETIEYKLATVEFKDLNGTTQRPSNVHVYKTSVEEGMSVGGTYLGKVQLSQNADGSNRTPWWTISSLVVGADFSYDDFEIIMDDAVVGL
jgi:hypothetical protein